MALLQANSQINSLFINHTIPQIIEHADRYKNEIREKQKQLRELVGSRYHDLIDVSEQIVLMQQYVQHFETELEGLVQDKLSDSQLDVGLMLNMYSVQQSPQSNFKFVGFSENSSDGGQDEANSVLQRAARTCDFLTSASQAQLASSDASKLFAESWKQLLDVPAASFSRWRRILEQKMLIVQRNMVAVLEQELARPLLVLSDAVSWLKSLYACKFSFEENGYVALLRHFLNVSRIKALNTSNKDRSAPSCIVQSFLATLLLTPLLFPESNVSRETIVEALQHWAEAAKDVVSRNLNVVLSTTPKELLDQEDAIRALFEQNTFDQLVAREQLISAGELSQLQWKQKWADIKKYLGTQSWNLYESRLRMEFADRQQHIIEQIISSENSDTAERSVKRKPKFVSRWTNALDKCRPLLDTQPANLKLFAQLWQQDLELFLNQNVENKSVSRSHDYRHIKHFVASFQQLLRFSVDTSVLNRLDALYVSCFDSWIESLVSRCLSMLQTSAEYTLWQHDEAMLSGWKNSTTSDGEHTLHVSLPTNPNPTVSKIMFTVNMELSTIGADRIDSTIVDELVFRLTEALLAQLSSTVSNACRNEVHSLQFLFDVQYLFASLLGNTYEKLAFKPEEQLQQLDRKFVVLARTILDGSYVDPVNWEVYEREFYNNLKSCLSRHAMYPLQMRHWRQLVIGSSALSKASLAEPSSLFLRYLDIPAQVQLPKLAPISANQQANDTIRDSANLKFPANIKPDVLPLEDEFDRLLFSSSSSSTPGSLPSIPSTSRAMQHQRTPSGDNDQQKGVLGSLWSSIRRTYSNSDEMAAAGATPPSGATPTTPAQSTSSISSAASQQQQQQSQRNRFFGLFSSS